MGRRFDSRFVALVVAALAAVVAIIISVVLGTADLVGAWGEPPREPSEKQAQDQAAYQERDEDRAALEARLPEEDAWGYFDARGRELYPAGFKRNAAGTIWATAADAEPWDLRATCHIVDEDGRETDAVCRARVHVDAAGKVEVTSFEAQ